MTRKCIFKATACKEVFRVVEIKQFGNETLWAVMNGRVYAERPFLYRLPDEAIDRALYLAKLELHKNNIIFYEP